MKLFIIASVLGLCAAGASQRPSYLPPFAHGSGGAGFANAGAFDNSGAYNPNRYNGPSNYARQNLGRDANAAILRYNNDVNEAGYAYDFETSNGIRADQSANAVNGVQAQGSFAYKGDDGHDYSISYTADENGYQPRGAHLPTPPPIPEAILRSLEQNARTGGNAYSDDGNYRDSNSGAYSGAGASSRAFPRFNGAYNTNTGYHY